jgi:protein-S-isoprenylcysteine O-methyltransferase Ste14
MAMGLPATRSRFIAGAYFLVQGIAVIGWWVFLALWPQTRAAFLPPGNDPSALSAFALPDSLLVAAGSLLTSVLVARSSGWALPIVWFVAGAIDYATFHVLAWAAIAGGGWNGFLLMAPAALLTTAFALRFASERLPLVRRARPVSAGWNVAKTLAQMAAFWAFFLAVLPAFLIRLEGEVRIKRFAFPGQIVLASALFVAVGALGVASGLTIARIGEGTPLPLDAPRRLVVAGPYAYVRNPMAIASFCQGECVGLGTGSWLVIAYVTLGIAIWNYLVRPSEEADLERTFGDAFVRYRRAVRCWIPRLRPYSEEQPVPEQGT